jgi:hypothetical protein
MCGAVNIEARVANDGQVYIIEIGPRNGGHFIPLIQQQLTGFDFVGRALDDALGIQEPISMDREVRRPGALVELHADHDGHLGAVFVSEELKPSILALELFVKVGDRVHQHRGSHTSIGVVSLAFSSSSEGDRFMDAISEHLRVEVSPSE